MHWERVSLIWKSSTFSYSNVSSAVSRQTDTAFNFNRWTSDYSTFWFCTVKTRACALFLSFFDVLYSTVHTYSVHCTVSTVQYVQYYAIRILVMDYQKKTGRFFFSSPCMGTTCIVQYSILLYCTLERGFSTM